MLCNFWPQLDWFSSCRRCSLCAQCLRCCLAPTVLMCTLSDEISVWTTVRSFIFSESVFQLNLIGQLNSIVLPEGLQSNPSIIFTLNSVLHWCGECDDIQSFRVHCLVWIVFNWFSYEDLLAIALKFSLRNFNYVCTIPFLWLMLNDSNLLVPWKSRWHKKLMLCCCGDCCYHCYGYSYWCPSQWRFYANCLHLKLMNVIYVFRFVVLDAFALLSLQSMLHNALNSSFIQKC